MSEPIYDELVVRQRAREAGIPEPEPETPLQKLARELEACAWFADGTRDGELVDLAVFTRHRLAKALRDGAAALTAAENPKCEHGIELSELCAHVDRVTNLSPGAAAIMEDRHRHLVEDGYAEEIYLHDARGLRAAAECYLLVAETGPDGWHDRNGNYVPPGGWPWHESFYKPSEDRHRNLVVAGGLIAAAIDAEEQNPTTN